MKRQNAVSGFSLIELLVVTVVLMLSGLALVTFIRVTYGAQDLISGQNSADATARQVLDTLADNIRDAQWYDTGVSSTSMVIRSANPPTATSITIYNISNDDGTGVTDGSHYTTYSLSGTNLQKSVDGGAATTILSGVQSLAFSYYVSTDYNNAITPVSSDYPHLGAVGIAATVSVSQLNTYTRQYKSYVKLRNSPPPS